MHRWQDYIRALTYPILFEANPLEAVGRVLTTVMDDQRLGTRDEFVEAIDHALASRGDLGKRFSENHSDAVMRGFLVEVARVLRTRGGSDSVPGALNSKDSP